MQYLINACRFLETVCRRNINGSNCSTVEAAIADIQFFGSVKQVQLAQQLSDEFAIGGTVDIDALLADLCADLRRERDLECVPESIKHL